MTLWAEPPRATVIVASARAVVFSVTIRNASHWALGPPAISFIILKCITCCVSIRSIAASTKHCRVAGDLHPVREQHVPSAESSVEEGQSQTPLFVPRIRRVS